MPSPTLNLTTIVLGLFVLCAGWVLFRGVLKMLLGCIVLAGSAWIGIWVWRIAPEFVRACCGVHLTWLATALPIVAFLVSFLLLRMIVNFLSNPFHRPGAIRPPLTLNRLLGAALLTIIPTCLLAALAALVIYHAGSVAELRKSADPAKAGNSGDWIGRLKSSLDQAIPQNWLQRLDPLADPARVTLAKLITAQSRPNPKPVIDPRTGKAIPRAIIVDDPELQTLAREGKFATLLRSPMLTKALNDPNVQAFLKNLQL